MSEGQFNLRKWRTDSKTLLKRINETENLPFDDTQLDNNLRENVKVLGLCWNTDSDEFTFNFDELIKFANSVTCGLGGGSMPPWVLESIHHSNQNVISRVVC